MGMDGGDFVMDLHIDTEAGIETFRCLKSQSIGIFNDISNIIRQAAVGIRNITGPFENNNLCFFIQSANPCRRGGTSGNSAYNYNFHIFVFLLCVFYLLLMKDPKQSRRANH